MKLLSLREIIKYDQRFSGELIYFIYEITLDNIKFRAKRIANTAKGLNISPPLFYSYVWFQTWVKDRAVNTSEVPSVKKISHDWEIKYELLEKYLDDRSKFYDFHLPVEKPRGK